jgi:homoserine dehydrogenase
MGFVIKLLAVAEQDDLGQIGVRVHPAMVPSEHPLAAVRESFNAVFVEGASVGDLMFYGRGAGGGPTASAILGDVIDAALNRHRGSHATVGQLATAVLRPIDDVESAYYLNVEVLDRPGVLAKVAGVFGDHRVSIRSMEQEGLGDEARLIFITHRAREADVQATLRDLRELEAVDRIGSVLRVVGDET